MGRFGKGSRSDDMAEAAPEGCLGDGLNSGGWIRSLIAWPSRRCAGSAMDSVRGCATRRCARARPCGWSAGAHARSADGVRLASRRTCGPCGHERYQRGCRVDEASSASSRRCPSPSNRRERSQADLPFIGGGSMRRRVMGRQTGLPTGCVGAADQGLVASVLLAGTVTRLFRQNNGTGQSRGSIGRLTTKY